MTHRVEVVRSVPVRPGVTWNSRDEWRIVCEKCGTVDKAGSERDAVAVARRHEAFPHR